MIAKTLPCIHSTTNNLVMLFLNFYLVQMIRIFRLLSTYRTNVTGWSGLSFILQSKNSLLVKPCSSSNLSPLI